MSGVDGAGPGINKFDGTYFAFWRLQIKDYLYSKKLHQPLSGRKPEKMEDEEWELLDRQMKGRIDSGEGPSTRSALNLDNRGRGRSVEIKCWSCGETGHLKKNCKSSKNNANVVTEEMHDALLLSMESPVDSWVMDSGASFHTTVGMGVEWHKVRHESSLTRNLLLVGQHDDEGHTVTFGDGSWKVSKGAMIVAQGKKTGTLYMNSSCRDKLAAVDAGANLSLWHYRLGHMSNNDFLRCQADNYRYVKKLDGSYIILLLYVDDMLIAGSCRMEIDKLKKVLSKKFAMKDLGDTNQILGMRILRDWVNGILKVSQGEYVKKVSRFNAIEAKPVSTHLASHFKLTKAQLPSTKLELDYASAVGSLKYAMMCTRHDIANVVGVVRNPADMLTKTVTTDKLKLRSTSVGLLA